MKKYKLKRWYPSLSKEWIEGDILDKHLQELDFFYVSGKMGLVDGDEVRNNPDFWEEVKPKPLFIPEKWKFKVGDKVRIKDGISSKSHSHIPPLFTSTMDKFIGKELTVKGYRNSDVFFNEDDSGYYFREDWLEPCSDEPKPLFVTDDGVEVFDKDFKFIMVDYVFEKFYASYVELVKPLNTDIFKYFAHESNADEYIAWHKKEFSVNDLLLADVGITTSQLDKLQELAKERIGR